MSDDPRSLLRRSDRLSQQNSKRQATQKGGVATMGISYSRLTSPMVRIQRTRNPSIDELSSEYVGPRKRSEDEASLNDVEKERLIKKFKKLKTELAEKQGEAEFWRDEAAQMHAKCQKLENSTNSMHLTSDLQAALQAEESKAQTYLLQRNQMKEKLKGCMADLRAAQGDAFQQAESCWVAVEDSQVRDAIAALYKEVRNWAKTYCVSSLGPFLEHIRFHQLVLQDVSKVGDFTSMESFDGFDHPFIILAALLSDHLQLSIFENPFFIFEEPRRLFESFPTPSRLFQIFSHMKSTDPPSAHKWRTELFRSAFPQTQDEVHLNMAEALCPQMATPEEISQIYHRITSNFIFGPAHTFMKPSLTPIEVKERFSRLQSLVIHAGNLFVQLQTQQVCYAWKSMASCLGHNFKVGSEYVKADRLHKLSDDTDTSHDGKAIKVVISPLIMAYGNSQGKAYDEGRVMGKAAVFLRDSVQRQVIDQDDEVVFLKQEKK